MHVEPLIVRTEHLDHCWLSPSAQEFQELDCRRGRPHRGGVDGHFVKPGHGGGKRTRFCSSSSAGPELGFLQGVDHLEGRALQVAAFAFTWRFLHGEVCHIEAGIAGLRSSWGERSNLVSQYLNFTDPGALEDLMAFGNVELRIETQASMHAKGYFFTHHAQEHYVIGEQQVGRTRPCLKIRNSTCGAPRQKEAHFRAKLSRRLKRLLPVPRL